MSEYETNIGLVGEMIRDLLPTLNEGFDWGVIREQYDNHPEGKAMSLHFTDESGESSVEDVHLGIADGPEVVVLPELTDEWDYIGAIVTYQDFGVRMLDPGDNMTPQHARYQHGAVTIHPAQKESRERVWLTVSNVLDLVGESLAHQQQTDDAEQSG